jgi:hypothetical protein
LTANVVNCFSRSALRQFGQLGASVFGRTSVSKTCPQARQRKSKRGIATSA